MKLSVACATSLAWVAYGYTHNETYFITHPMAQSDKPDLDFWLQSVGFTSSVLNDSHAHVNGHVVKVSNPIDRFSVVEPQPGGCGTIEMVRDTAKRYSPECIIATNGGFFSLHEETKFACFGSLVTDGKVVQTEPMPTQNVNFGVTHDNQWVIGYITPQDVKKGNYKQLIQGLGWLVHKGKNNVANGWKDAYTASGSSGDKYATLTSGRVGIGWNAAGELIIMTFDGHTKPPYSWGVTMYEMADKLIEMGAVEAINMDGGGSTTLVHNGVEIGYPGDRHTYGILRGWYDPSCPIGLGKTNVSNFECVRYVSTILCLHEDRVKEPVSGITPSTMVVAAVGGAVLLGAGYMIGKMGKSQESLEGSETEEENHYFKK